MGPSILAHSTRGHWHTVGRVHRGLVDLCLLHRVLLHWGKVHYGIVHLGTVHWGHNIVDDRCKVCI